MALLDLFRRRSHLNDATSRRSSEPHAGGELAVLAVLAAVFHGFDRRPKPTLVQSAMGGREDLRAEAPEFSMHAVREEIDSARATRDRVRIVTRPFRALRSLKPGDAVPEEKTPPKETDSASTRG
jgi:hypothetical protein